MHMLGLGNNHETMIIVSFWPHTNHTMKTFLYRELDIINNTAVIIKFVTRHEKIGHMCTKYSLSQYYTSLTI